MVPMQRPIPVATAQTSVLLIHSPYPGRLKFDGLPSSLLHAIGPFAASGFHDAAAESLGYLDPGTPSRGFYKQLRGIAASRKLRVACISTSTAAIEETAQIIRVLREEAHSDLLIIVGGPHEDDCQVKVATAVPGVDISISGDAEYVLDWILQEHLRGQASPPELCERLARLLSAGMHLTAGVGAITCSWWNAPSTRTFDFGRPSPNDPTPCATIDKVVRFSVFDTPRTIPVMISRGCSYGKCTFCAEGARGGGQLVHPNFSWLRELLASSSESALYFQDSIFPNNQRVRDELLPLLREWGGEWGCQVYLKTLSRSFLRSLAQHGCKYIYTGVETGSAEILAAIGKQCMSQQVALERLGWFQRERIPVGISLMFGSMAEDGQLLETESTVRATVEVAEKICGAGIQVAGYYPNVQTVLPGTRLARGLEASGLDLDFYTIPRCEVFDVLEDGGVGYNFMTLPSNGDSRGSRVMAERIVRASVHVQALGMGGWEQTMSIVREQPHKGAYTVAHG